MLSVGVRLFKTSWWAHISVPLTTAVLRRVLQRVGGGLLRLHIDHHWSALNDRTAHTVGKFCPQLEEVKVSVTYLKVPEVLFLSGSSSNVFNISTHTR